MNIWDRQPSYNGDPPLFYLGSIPMNLTATLVATHITTMILCAFLLATGYGDLVTKLSFYSTAIANERMFTIFTYVFVHDITKVSIFFALEMLVFYWLGREVESYIGRNLYGCLYAILAVIPPVILIVLSALGLPPAFIQGSSTIHFGIMVAFATLYPNVGIFFGVSAKWIVVILLGINSLVYLALGNIAGLAYLWITVGTCYATMRYIGVTSRANFGIGDQIRDWKQERAEKKMRQKKDRLKKQEEQFHRDVDDILEKIAREGISSLTDAEKEALEKARSNLLRKDKRP